MKIVEKRNKKIAAVTGALGVLGKSITSALLNEGFRVVMIDLSSDELNTYSSLLDENMTLPIKCDISDSDAVDKAVETIKEKWGSIDVLVNNAGILSNNKATDTSPEEWKRVMRVNVDGAFYFSRAVMKSMREKKWGRIINISSLAGKNGGITAGTAYSVSKGALITLTYSLAGELASSNVTVNGIAPAYVKTPMITEQLTEDEREDVIRKIPLKRFCEAEEVAYTVKFLVNDLAGFITGAIIDQNGGLQFG